MVAIEKGVRLEEPDLTRLERQLRDIAVAIDDLKQQGRDEDVAAMRCLFEIRMERYRARVRQARVANWQQDDATRETA